MPPLTFKAIPEFTDSTAPLALLLKVIEWTFASTVTVTKSFVRITTSSLVDGTIPPVQEPVEFQLPPPVPFEVRTAAKVLGAPRSVRLRANRVGQASFIIEFAWSF